REGQTEEVRQRIPVPELLEHQDANSGGHVRLASPGLQADGDIATSGINNAKAENGAMLSHHVFVLCALADKVHSVLRHGIKDVDSLLERGAGASDAQSHGGAVANHKADAKHGGPANIVASISDSVVQQAPDSRIRARAAALGQQVGLLQPAVHSQSYANSQASDNFIVLSLLSETMSLTAAELLEPSITRPIAKPAASPTIASSWYRLSLIASRAHSGEAQAQTGAVPDRFSGGSGQLLQKIIGHSRAVIGVDQAQCVQAATLRIGRGSGAIPRQIGGHQAKRLGLIVAQKLIASGAGVHEAVSGHCGRNSQQSGESLFGSLVNFRRIGCHHFFSLRRRSFRRSRRGIGSGRGRVNVGISVGFRGRRSGGGRSSCGIVTSRPPGQRRRSQGGVHPLHKLLAGILVQIEGDLERGEGFVFGARDQTFEYFSGTAHIDGNANGVLKLAVLKAALKHSIDDALQFSSDLFVALIQLSLGPDHVAHQLKSPPAQDGGRALQLGSIVQVLGPDALARQLEWPHGAALSAPSPTAAPARQRPRLGVVEQDGFDHRLPQPSPLAVGQSFRLEDGSDRTEGPPRQVLCAAGGLPPRGGTRPPRPWCWRPWCWRPWCWRPLVLRPGAGPCWRPWCAPGAGALVLAPWCWLVLAPLVLAPLVLAPLVLALVLAPGAGAPGAALVLAPLVLAPLVLAPLVLAPLVLAPLVLKPLVLVLKPLVLKPLVLKPLVLKPLVLKPLVLKPLVLKPLVLKQEFWWYREREERRVQGQGSQVRRDPMSRQLLLLGLLLALVSACGSIERSSPPTRPLGLGYSDYPDGRTGHFGSSHIPIAGSLPSDMGSGKRCQPITIPVCQGIGYNYTFMPNHYNHETQAEAGISNWRNGL
uniref:ANK_REP_REGION domain-containing protein n=1 Tax=Macrostomum lignano TaxID=282301 RepID=A0A1I8HYX0_9PLAT